MSVMPAEVKKQETRAANPAVVESKNIFDDLKSLIRSIERRAYDLFDGRGKEPGRDLEDWLKAETELMRPVLCEVKEADDHLTVQAEVPGFASEDLKVSVEPDRLFIRGSKESNKKEETENTIYTECSAKEVFRTLYLPAEVDPSKVTAELKDGVLNIMLPKTKTATKVNVEVKST